MSLFVSALDSTDAGLLAMAKTGVVVGYSIPGTVGYAILRSDGRDVMS